ncbi:MAG: flagellar hook-associated protein FlgK [Eubacteriales bacterium]|nr:flagellar hook-associated protein FlgK [Eubacteriales bacterium]
MSSTFSGFDIARKALSVSQKAMDVTGHNIANANTPGYTRQRLVVASVEATGIQSRFAVSERGAVGGGVEAVTVEQIRNAFLDRQYWRENATSSELTARSEHLAYVESVFDELSGTGLSNALAKFSASVQEVAKNPVSPEFRTNLVQNAQILTETFNHAASQLLDKQTDLDQTIAAQVLQVNDIAVTLADYNGQIARYELSGQRANDLRDKRNALLDELSGLVQFTAVETGEGKLQVYIGDSSEPDNLLVSHTTSRSLSATATLANPLNSSGPNLLAVTWSDGPSLDLSSGSLKGLFDLRDGAAADAIGLPYLASQLDELAQGIATAFNIQHQAGYTLTNPSATGGNFFSGTGAADLAVDAAILADINTIALAGDPVTFSSSGTPDALGDNVNALRMGDLFTSQTIPDIGSFSGFLGTFIGSLAIETAHTDSRLSGQQILVESIDQQRESVAGVSMDEEMTNLVRFEKSYAAAARLVTAIDEMLDVLINRTGVVGR